MAAVFFPIMPPLCLQVMLAWDASRTFSCFFYPQNGIQWLQASDMNSPAAVVSTCLTVLPLAISKSPSLA